MFVLKVKWNYYLKIELKNRTLATRIASWMGNDDEDDGGGGSGERADKWVHSCTAHKTSCFAFVLFFCFCSPILQSNFNQWRRHKESQNLKHLGWNKLAPEWRNKILSVFPFLIFSENKQLWADYTWTYKWCHSRRKNWCLQIKLPQTRLHFFRNEANWKRNKKKRCLARIKIKISRKLEYCVRHSFCLHDTQYTLWLILCCTENISNAF